MPAAPSSPLVSQRRWPWMVTSRGAASWKSASNVVFVDGTSTPMRFRAVIVGLVEAQGIALGSNGLHGLEPVLGHVAVELDAIAVGIREIHAVRDIVRGCGLDLETERLQLVIRLAELVHAAELPRHVMHP